MVSIVEPKTKLCRLRLDNSIPTWRYLYQGSFPNLSPKPWLGAYHSSEIPFIFGTYNVSTPYSQPASKAEIETSRYMQEAWVAFAKDPRHGLSNYGWPQFNFQSQYISYEFILFEVIYESQTDALLFFFGR
ncbi:hypothetical protein N7481_000964 [Penicillium waksmanii]|uniref:uncharacterized protein n=1 Tax=Penicillium waksmanii TaxID=69791 RepID=UPI00254857D8|nr:uncharacterized protein N7481_000964 [Penicillium waksmanii]KAJ6000555.1 hypothetical protein N7481_000964 [Penicillium waksmanii]